MVCSYKLCAIITGSASGAADDNRSNQTCNQTVTATADRNDTATACKHTGIFTVSYRSCFYFLPIVALGRYESNLCDVNVTISREAGRLKPSMKSLCAILY